jgi:hypothetical protein
MTGLAIAPEKALTMLDGEPQYQPGVCNIGPAEIARRRRAGHVGLAATIGLLVGLILVRAPRRARLVVALPGAVAASGYLQAHFRFCAGFGSQGVYNFDGLGSVIETTDATARARDRATAMRIGLAGAAIGAIVGVAAAVAPR